FFILKNPQEYTADYYLEFYSLLAPVFIVTILLRIPFINKAQKQLRLKQVFFNVLLIGDEKNAAKFFLSFIETKEKRGYRITSFLNTNENKVIELPAIINKYNDLENLKKI